MSDEKHEEIRRLSSSLIEKNPKVFEPLLFSSNSVEDHDHGNLGRNRKLWTHMYSYCASLLK